MSKSEIPWKLNPVMHRVNVPGVDIFDIPLYSCLLIDEVLLWNKISGKLSSGTEEARAFVVHSLRLRGVIAESVTDEQLAPALSVDLVSELFDLFFYGTKGKPEPSQEKEGKKKAEKKKSTGPKSSGSSSATTQEPQSSAEKPLAVAQ